MSETKLEQAIRLRDASSPGTASFAQWNAEVKRLGFTPAARYDAAMDRIYENGSDLMTYAVRAIRREPKAEAADITEALATELAALLQKYGITE